MLKTPTTCSTSAKSSFIAEKILVAQDELSSLSCEEVFSFQHLVGFVVSENKRTRRPK